ncbi:unnamed protein product, partial [Durusdinium trenchii]
IREKCLFPGRKPRHERCNLQELVKRSEKEYVDFQEVSVLKDLKEFTDDPANNPKGRKFKNLSERRKYVKELGLTVVRDPKTNADAVPVHDRTVMLSGHRVSASRSKQENFDDKREAKEAFTSAKQSVGINTNKKDPAIHIFHGIAGTGGVIDEEDGDGKKRKHASASASKRGTVAAPKKAARKDDNQRSRDGPAAPKKPEDVKDTKGADKRVESCLTNGKKCLQQLSELTSDAIWRSQIRGHELDRRIAKVTSVRADLQKLSTKANASAEQKQRAVNLDDELADAATTTNALKEVCRIFRSHDAKQLVEEVSSGTELAQHVSACADRLLADPSVLMDMIHIACKKLAEVTWTQ